MRVVVVALALGAFAGCSKKEAPPDTVSAADFASAKAKVAELDAARTAALGAAKDAIVGRADLGRCPVDVGTFGPQSNTDLTGTKKAWGGYDVKPWKDHVSGSDVFAGFADELCAIERLGIEQADEAGQKPGPRAIQMMALERDKDLLAPSKWQVDGLRKTQGEVDFELVIDAELPPQIVSEKSFSPGIIRARFYVWDYEKSAIVCAARITAESSDALSAAGTDKQQTDMLMTAGLLSDLREQALAKVKDHLYVAGPPRGAGDLDAGSSDATATDAGRKPKKP